MKPGTIVTQPGWNDDAGVVLASPSAEVRVRVAFSTGVVEVDPATLTVLLTVPEDKARKWLNAPTGQHVSDLCHILEAQVTVVPLDAPPGTVIAAKGSGKRYIVDRFGKAHLLHGVSSAPHAPHTGPFDSYDWEAFGDCDEYGTFGYNPSTGRAAV